MRTSWKPATGSRTACHVASCLGRLTDIDLSDKAILEANLGDNQCVRLVCWNNSQVCGRVQQLLPCYQEGLQPRLHLEPPLSAFISIKILEHLFFQDDVHMKNIDNTAGKFDSTSICSRASYRGIRRWSKRQDLLKSTDISPQEMTRPECLVVVERSLVLLNLSVSTCCNTLAAWEKKKIIALPKTSAKASLPSS